MLLTLTEFWRSWEFLNCPNTNPQLSVVRLNTYVTKPNQINTSVVLQLLSRQKQAIVVGEF